MQITKNFIIVSSEMPDDIKNKLKNSGFTPLPSCKVDLLDTSVSSHPDLQLLSFLGKLYAAKNCYSYYCDLFAENQLSSELECLDLNVFSPYPNDCILNFTVFNNYLIKGKKVTLQNEFCGYNVVEVNQGYVNCSVLKLNDNAAITEDVTIYNALCSIGVDCLLLPERKVLLKGCNCGFIGGAGFSFDNKVYFFGKIEEFDYFDKIKAFCNKHGFETVSLSCEKVEDYGKAVIIS